MNLSFLTDVIFSDNRRNRFRILLIVIPSVIGLLMTYTPKGSNSSFLSSLFGLDDRFLNLTAIMFFAGSFISLMMMYLQTGFKDQNGNSNPNFENFLLIEKNIHNKILKLEAQISNLDKASSKDFVSEEEKLRFVEEFKKDVLEISRYDLLNELKESIINYDKENFYNKQILSLINDSKNRLKKEILDLGLRANINLSVGVATSAIGLAVLGWSLFNGEVRATSLNEFVYSNFPKISFVILIELFAFFFLSLYKTSLSEIKYFQNEITNIDIKNIALVALIKEENKDSMSEVLKNFSSTERNFILSKGETTVQLENKKIENQIDHKLFKIMTDFFKKND